MQSVGSNDPSVDIVNLKCIIVGDSSVGKTCLLKRYHKGEFNVKTIPTVGSDFIPKIITKQRKEGTTMVTDTFKLSFWDCAGQEKYLNVVKALFKGSHGALLVFDLTCRDSFKDLANWYRMIKKNAKERVVIIIVGNKSDLKKGQSENLIGVEEIMNFQNEHNNIEFFECSALDGNNVEKAFNRLIDLVYQTYFEDEKKNLQQTSRLLISSILDKKPPPKKSCC